MIAKLLFLFLQGITFFFLSTGIKDNLNSLVHHAARSKPPAYNYDLSHPSKKWILPGDLKEISGQAWVDKNHILAIEDLHPILYLVKMDNKAIVEKRIPFKKISGKKTDIEDVALVKNTAYALWSHGVLFKIKNWQTEPKVKKIETPLSKENNTEGLCYDPVSYNLLIACKNESDVEDQKKSTRSIFEFDLKADTLITDPFMLIRKKDFKKFADEKLGFFPSAIAVHPVTHDIYILSTKETKCMAVYSYKGELKSFQLIDKNLLLQPEGICFAPDGTLYISSEGKHGTPPVLLRFDAGK
ncbi:MAG: SdiA-regulated domain-containing protein [Bacteroidetes bacterium]|nr:SdiA-regulated domain-containing protein [Bacteroidota bacterium]MBS1930373.1 SdiA-regulated domain-containing protein [Bacteroidota bacterium]